MAPSISAEVAYARMEQKWSFDICGHIKSPTP
jgi:hypothetical protein